MKIAGTAPGGHVEPDARPGPPGAVPDAPDAPRTPAPDTESLRQSEERFRLLVAAVRDYAIFMLDPNGYIVTWNTGAHRIKGYEEHEIVGRHFSVFYTPEDRERDVPASVLRAAAKAGHCQLEGWRLAKDGHRFWADVTVTALRGKDGALIGFAKVTRDLTERHAADEALRQSEERFRLLVEAVRDYAIFMLDPNGYIVTWNTGAHRIKGYEEHEIVGRHFSVFYTPEDRDAGKPPYVLAEARRTGRYEEEGWRVRKDGSAFWANVVITPLRDQTGALRGFSKVTRDLTIQREAEEDRRRRFVAEDAARLRDEFLSVAAHELKTPVAVLRGRAQLAQRYFQRDGAGALDQITMSLGVIDAQAGKLARLVEQLLDVTRLDTGRLVLERRDTDIGALAATVVDLFRSREDGTRLRLDVPAHPVMAPVDALRIEQVLTNLVENALKYSIPASPVWVSVRGEVVAGTGAGSAASPVTIVIRDEGPGVPPEDRPYLFTRFFRSRASGYSAGMGLGLYVSRQIVELHGGSIRAEFPPDGGTHMVVELPRP